VRLYQAIPPDVPVGTMDDGCNRTMATQRAMGSAIPIEPVPRHIGALVKVVKALSTPDLNHVAGHKLKVYEPMGSAGDELSLPSTEAYLLPGDLVPLSSTSLSPLVVVVPAIPAVKSPTAAVHEATKQAGQTSDRKDNPEAMESAWDQAKQNAVVPKSISALRNAAEIVQAVVHTGSWKGYSERKLRLHRAKEFAKSIMLNIEDIPGSSGMKVMRDVVDLETGMKRDIVLRSFINRFWSDCIKFLDDPMRQTRLCVVGTPGIGKTTGTAFPIRKLLADNQTVVYHIRNKTTNGWYHEFVPKGDGSVAVNVYPGNLSIAQIPSLALRSTYYIVDPGRTKDSCLQDDDFAPKFMIVSSPEEGHWGGSEFQKYRGLSRWTFRYLPVWDLKDILFAQKHLMIESVQLTSKQVEERFREFGGVPRNIFLADTYDLQQKQKKAIAQLTDAQVLDITKNHLDAIGTFAAGQPKSAIICYAKDDDENPNFSIENVEIISPEVAEKVYSKFIGDLWDPMISNELVKSSKVFETYCRRLIARPALGLKRRPCVGKRNPDYHTTSTVDLGNCNKIRIVSDIVRAGTEHPMVLFHSNDPRHPLFDFMYRGENGTYYAFQATISDHHDPSPSQIDRLRQKIGTSQLEFYFMVPEEQFGEFVTNPVEPFAEDKNTNAWHLLVPNPNRKRKIITRSRPFRRRLVWNSRRLTVDRPAETRMKP
jgi:hypothetical protein